MKTFLQPLTAREEREYLRQNKEGDREARNVLISRNMRLVAHVIKKYQNSGYETEDLLSVGTIGLIKAVDSYNKEGKDVIELMPEDAYSIQTTSITLKSGEKEAKTSVSVNGEYLKNWHSYAIPVTIKSVSQYYFEESKKTIFVIYRPDNLQGWYTVEGLEKNSKDWSVSSYPIRRFIKKTGPYTYETGYGARCYCDAETTANAPNDRQYIVRNPVTNQLLIREGTYIDMNASNHYDPCYEFEGWPGTWTHELMHSRSNASK